MKNVLRRIGRLTPNIRYLRAVPTRVLTPIHHALGYEGGTVDVLGSRMILDPRECVDNGLWFQPHLYDRAERIFICKHANAGAFFDVGANIGFWSLFLARKFPTSDIFSIEANPNTAKILRSNIEINGYDNIKLIEAGVGPERGQFDLYLNTTGNRGGDSFVSDGSRSHKITVDVERISDLIAKLRVQQIEFMKMDVEGMEEGILYDIFHRLSRGTWPRLICVETLHSAGIESMLQGHGYQIALRARENSIFRRVNAG